MTDRAVTIGANAAYDINDEDAMTSDDDRALATQQSIKAYVDAREAAAEATAEAYTDVEAGPKVKYVTGEIANISSAASSWTVAPISGTITKIWTVIDGAITVGDAAITFELDGVAITGGAITIAHSGSAAGTIDSCTPTALNTVSAGDAIEIITDGGSTDAAKAEVLFEITPHAAVATQWPKNITGEIADVSSGASSWVVSPITGDITNIYLVLEKAVTVANAAITFEIGGVAVTGGAITIAHATSAIGKAYSCTPTAARRVLAGQAIEIITDGGSTTASKATVVFEITPVATTATPGQRYIYGEVANISAAASSWTIAPVAGTISKIYSVIDGAITVANAGITFELGGTAITDGAITIAHSGSAAGTVDSCTPSALNTVAAGDAIEIVADGASTDAAKAVIIIEITPAE